MNKIKLTFIILFLILVNSHSNSNELNNLFFKLKNAENFSKATNIEKKIWNIWITNGSNQKNNSEMSKGLILFNNGNLKKALKVFLNLCEVEPEWAEPFNKVATIKFLQKDYLTSIKYIELTLEKERRHFGAISGLAQINLRLGRFENALNNINQVLKIHPFISIKKIKPFLLEKLRKKEIKFHELKNVKLSTS